MGGEDGFCENYLVLKPEKANCFDCIRILCWCDLEQREFFNTRVTDRVRSFGHRWIIFISVLVQKILVYLKNPMAVVGSIVERWLNYPPFNGGYRRLLRNILTGRVVRPNRSSAIFTSIVGNLDMRQELEQSIRYGDNGYNASLAVMASKLSYENEAFVQNVVTNHWQMEFLEFYNFWNDYHEEYTTHAIMFQNKKVEPNVIVVAFRGTEPFNADAWRTDMDVSWYEFLDIGKIHGGFMKALGLQKSTGWPKEAPQTSNDKPFAYYTIRQKLKSLMHENEDAKFIVTGHSLGGALAILFAGILTIHEEETLLKRLVGVYTFGQPRVGNEQFGDYMKRKMISYDVKYFRYVYSNDLVPRLPYDDKTFLFKHFGPCLYYNSSYRGRVLGEEPNKNYFSLLFVVPKILNAGYELIRSFILPWTKGEDYKEGWFMKLFRVTALVIPGLADHFLIDYVNVTRLGKLSSFIYPQGSNLNLRRD